MKRFQGIPAAPGVASGPAFLYRPVQLHVERRACEDPALEWVRCQAAVRDAARQLVELRQRAAVTAGEEQAAIFDAHEMIARDPEIEAELRAEVEAGASAEAAVETVFARAVDLFAALEDPLFGARAADFADVGRRLLCALLGVQGGSLAELRTPAVVVAHDLLPSDTAQLDKARVRAFCTAVGGPLSHTAILARSLGLPAVVGAGEGLLELADGEPLIVDGDAGVVIAGAEAAEQAQYARRADAAAQARAADLAEAGQPAVSRDGRRVEVAANIGLPGEEQAALEAGAEGIGLLRTEFLFLGRAVAPSEDEQYAAYRPILEAMGARPVVARTLDIGGDKPVPFLEIPAEANPFLGWRAIRIGLERPALLKTQLRALLRAGHGCNLKIMFPMVATAGEMAAARALAVEAQAELADEGLPSADPLEIGTMIEVPAAALLAERLAEHADFFSLGSNDLTQYTMAADRGNPAVAGLSDALHPAVLRLVDMAVRAGHAASLWVGMCGELAGDPLAIPVLFGLGLDEFSIGAAAIPAAKALIRRLSQAEAQALAEQALALTSAGEVRELVKEFLAKIEDAS